MIDYAQLGLMFKLYSCEVLFNRGLCYIYLQQKEAGMQDFSFAVKEKVVEDHNVIDDAIREEAEVSSHISMAFKLWLVDTVPSRVTRSSPSPLESSTDRTQRRLRTSRRRTIWGKRD